MSTRRPIRSTLCGILLCCCAVTQLCAQPDPGRFSRWMVQDAVALGSALIDGRTPLYALGTAGLMIPMAQLDPPLNAGLRDARSGGFGTYLDVANTFGGPDINLPVAGVFAVSLLTKDTRFQDAAFTSLQSLLYTGALDYGLKFALGRVRPDESREAIHFRPFSGKSSFPSGHTTAAFAVLTPWVLYYPHPVTYGLFTISTGTALSRIAREKHWTSDVLAGGLLGFTAAYWLTRRHQQARPGFHLTPVATPDAFALSLRLAF